MCRPLSLVWSYRRCFVPVPLSFDGICTGCRPASVLTSSSALSRSQPSTLACRAEDNPRELCTLATQSCYTSQTLYQTFADISLQPQLQWSGTTYLRPSMSLSAYTLLKLLLRHIFLTVLTHQHATDSDNCGFSDSLSDIWRQPNKSILRCIVRIGLL